MVEKSSDQIDIIAKIEEFEMKKEINKFFLVMFISGYIGIISSFIEYFFHSVYQIDVTFYIFQELNSQHDLSIASQPFLFIIVWSMHFFPLFAIFFYTSEKAGIIDFTQSYRKIAFFTLLLFIIAEAGVLTLTKNNYTLIPVIWGLIVSIGLIFCGIIFYRDFSLKIIAITMIICSFLTIVEVILVFVFLKDNHLAPTVIPFSIGIMLIGMSIITYFLRVKNKISYKIPSSKSNITNLEEDEGEIIRDLKIIDNYLKNTIGVGQGELFDYIIEARKVVLLSGKQTNP